MARRSRREPPKTKMPGWKALLLYGIAITFDFIKFLFIIFVFSAPFIASFAVNIYLTSHSWPAWIAGFAGFVVGAGVVATEAAATPIAAAFEFIGVILASAAGFLGWLIIWTVLLLSRINPFTHKSTIQNMVGFLATEIPFINLFPTITPSVYLAIRTARKEDREAREEWEQEQKELNAKEELENARIIAEIQQSQEAGAQIAAMRANTENDNEIPESQEKAA